MEPVVPADVKTRCFHCLLQQLTFLFFLLSISNTTAQKHQFFGAQLSSQSNSHIHT